MSSRNYSNLPILLARPSGAEVVTEAESEQDNIGKTLCDDMKKQVHILSDVIEYSRRLRRCQPQDQSDGQGGQSPIPHHL